MGSTKVSAGRYGKWASSIVLIVLVFASAIAETTTTEQIDAVGEQDGEACVTLIEYGNRQCTGHSTGQRQFSTRTAPGSPCKHTAAMGKNSAKDQYCVFDQDIFKQTVYISSTNCKVPVWEKAISPMHLTYSHNKCTYGYKLGSCEPGPCSSNGNEEGDTSRIFDDENVIEPDSFSHLRSS